MNLLGSIKKFGRGLTKFLGSSVNGGWLSGWVLPGQWGRKQLLEQYERYVYTVVSAIAENEAKIEMEAFRLAGNDKRPVLGHSLLKVFEKPNPEQSQFQFLENHFTYMKLSGESFWYLLRDGRGKILQMHLLRPDLMDVAVKGEDDNPLGLVTGYTMRTYEGKKIPFSIDEILHFKLPNPLNPYRGLGPVQAAKLYIETEEYSTEFTRNSIYNSGRPSGIVNLKGTIDDSQFQKIKRQFKNQYSGTENAGKTMIIKGTDGIEYTKLGMGLGEIELRELKEMTRDDIMIMFRASKTVLGISDDVNRANAHEARIVFNENIIKPDWDRFVDHINAFLVPQMQPGTFIEYKTPTLKTDKEKSDEYAIAVDKWMTRNEIRDLEGLEPVQGGNFLYIPINLIPIGSTPDSQERKLTKTHKKKLTRWERGELFRLQLMQAAEHWMLRYRRAVNKEFEAQRKEILDKHPNKNMTASNKALVDWLFNVDEAKARMQALLIPLGIEIMSSQAEPAFDLAGDDESEFQINQRVRDYVTRRVDKLADNTNDETIRKINQSLADGIAAGESLSKLKKRINTIYFDATTKRSERIARTETIAASNEAANEAYRQSPVVTAKEWHVEPDACEFCRTFSGKVVGLDEPFAANGTDVSGEEGGNLRINYENIEHPPLHPNCRCAILPVAQ
jgi:HK97 family phage portal protein